MSNEQRMREAFESLVKQGHMIGRNDFQTGWEAAEQALTAPAGMNSEQKMRDAFKAAFAKAHWVDHKTYDECIDAGITAALAAPAGEQVGLTRGELWAAIDNHVERLQRHTYEYGLIAEGAIEIAVQIGSAAIAAHEAKRASCSQTAKKSTHEVGRVDETGKSEHVGGAA